MVNEDESAGAVKKFSVFKMMDALGKMVAVNCMDAWSHSLDCECGCSLTHAEMKKVIV